jgi:hypothetical protein
MGSGVVFGGQFLTAYTRSVSHLQLRTVSALLMSIVLVSPVLGAVCSIVCVEGAPAHHRSAQSGHDRATSSPEADDAGAPSQAPLTAHRHHSPSPASPVAASGATAPPAEWKGRCCEQPAASLLAIPVMRHELPIASPPVDILPAIRIGSGDIGHEAVSRRDASPPLLSLQRSALVLRI